MKKYQVVRICKLCKCAGLSSMYVGDSRYCSSCTIDTFYSGNLHANKTTGEKISEFIDRIESKRSELRRELSIMRKLQNRLNRLKQNEI